MECPCLGLGKITGYGCLPGSLFAVRCGWTTSEYDDTQVLPGKLTKLFVWMSSIDWSLGS